MNRTRLIVLSFALSFFLFVLIHIGGSDRPQIKLSESTSSTSINGDTKTKNDENSDKNKKEKNENGRNNCGLSSSPSSSPFFIPKNICKNCKSWPSFLSERTRKQCAPILRSIEDAIPILNINDEKLREKDRNHLKILESSSAQQQKRNQQFLKDRRPSSPFITGDGFRSVAKFIFDEVTVPTWDETKMKDELLSKWMHRDVVDEDQEKIVNSKCHDIKYNHELKKIEFQKDEKIDRDTYPLLESRGDENKRKTYWHLVSKRVVELSENALLKKHSQVMNVLRFDCLRYGDSIFVQTHLLDKFIDEVFPILEKRFDFFQKNTKKMKNQKGSNADARSRFPGLKLITHNSDYSSPWDSSNTRGIKTDPENAKFEKQIERLLLSPVLIRWYGQNMVLSPQRQITILQKFQKMNLSLKSRNDDTSDRQEENLQLVKRRLSKRTFKMIEAKMIPIPIGIENRYNKYGKFVASDYALAAGCFEPSFANILRTNSESNEKDFGDRQNALEEKFHSTEREIFNEPFVAFSVKTNKRERQDAISAIEANFGVSISPSSSFTTLNSKIASKCVQEFTKQYQKIKSSPNHPYSATFRFDQKSSETGGGKDRKNQETLITYLAKLKCFGFTMAPHGHGVDTHRIWEALYTGSVPITSQSSMDLQLLSQLPVFIAREQQNSGNEENKMSKGCYRSSLNSTNDEEYFSKDEGLLFQPPAAKSKYFYKKGTFANSVTKKNLERFWCQDILGVVQETLYGNALDEKNAEGGDEEKNVDGKTSGTKRGAELFWKYSMHLPVSSSSFADENHQNNADDAKRDKSIVPATSKFNFDLLDMSFWAELITKAEHRS